MRVCLTLWCNVAIPGLLYAADVVPIPDKAIQDIDLIKTQLGKELPQSTANLVVQVDWGGNRPSCYSCCLN